MEVYLVVVVLVPTAKEKHDIGTGATIITGPHAIIARDEQQAAMKAYRFIPEEHASKEDRLEVRVLPFRAAAGRA
jgi:hypothetical protein